MNAAPNNTWASWLRWTLGLLFLSGALTAEASRVHFRPLKEVVQPDTVIVLAEVTHQERIQTDTTAKIVYDIQVARTLQGPPLTSMTRAEYYPPGFPGGMSPIIDASGTEEHIEDGGTYLFFARHLHKDDKTLRVFRVEPARREHDVLVIVEGHRARSKPEHR